MVSDIPSELEYVSDFHAQENFRQSFRRQLDRCLILMIRDPEGSFELSLAGIDILLDYYKDATYLDDVDTIAYTHKKELEELGREKRKGVAIQKKLDNGRFTSNISRFRALMRLAGRASFLPFPPVAITAGGRNADLKYKDDEITSDEAEAINYVLDKNLEEYQELSDKKISDLQTKGKIEEAKEDDSPPKR